MKMNIEIRVMNIDVDARQYATHATSDFLCCDFWPVCAKTRNRTQLADTLPTCCRHLPTKFCEAIQNNAFLHPAEAFITQQADCLSYSKVQFKNM